MTVNAQNDYWGLGCFSSPSRIHSEDNIQLYSLKSHLFCLMGICKEQWVNTANIEFRFFARFYQYSLPTKTYLYKCLSFWPRVGPSHLFYVDTIIWSSAESSHMQSNYKLEVATCYTRPPNRGL